MSRLLLRLTSPSRLRLIGGLFGAAMLAAFLIRALPPAPLVQPNGVPLGRDFLVFYAAGRMVREGDGARLYDPRAQSAMQDSVLAPGRREGMGYFTNPAPLAAAYTPLASLPYRTAFLFHTGLMALLVVAGVRALRGVMPGLAPHWGLAALLGLLWFPLLNAVTGGQNTASSFALLAVAYTGTVRRMPSVAGAALGLLLYKPQLALPLLGLLLLRREYRTGSAAAVTTLAAYAAGAFAAGYDWPARMLRALRFFHREERLANGQWLISIPESLDYALARPFEGSAAGASVAAAVHALGWVLVLAAVMWLVLLWRRADPAREDFGLYWALAVAATPLVSPHTQHYEAGVLLLPVLLMLDWMIRRGVEITPATRLALVAGFFVYPVYLLAPRLGFQPLVLLPVAVAVWAASLIQLSSRGSEATEGSSPRIRRPAE
jgi:hypothetical protein